MQNRVLSTALKENIGKQVILQGWLYKKRELGGMTFLILRDRKGLIQILDEKSQEVVKLIGLQNGTVLTVRGVVVEDERAPGGVEIHEPEIEVIVPVEYVMPVEVDKPIDHTQENLETLFENRIINIRNITEQGIFKVQAGIKQATREYLIKEDFVEFNSPKFLAGSTEGGAEVFKLDYFGKEATLAQSAQFYKQIMVGAFERAFEINPTYRAEPSMTTRHMTEFIHIDAEMGFIDGLQDILDLLSGHLNYVSNYVWEKCGNELEALKAVKPLLTEKIPVVTLKKMHELYFEETGEDMRKERDPSPAEERWICEYMSKEQRCEAVFITEFPAYDMKFYHKRSQLDPEVAERADLLFRGVEIVTGSVRENRFDVLVSQMKEKGLDPEQAGFKYYLQAFKYGMPAHGGFGMGLERLTQKIVGLNNVKEATLFPRDINRLTP